MKGWVKPLYAWIGSSLEVRNLIILGVDVWAAGCTAFELATGSFLFQPKVGGV